MGGGKVKRDVLGRLERLIASLGIVRKVQRGEKVAWLGVLVDRLLSWKAA